MKNVMTGQVTALTAAAQTLSAHRCSIMNMLVGCPLITTAEYDTAMQRTLACQELAKLQRWYRNCAREIARRQEGSPVAAPLTYATAEQVQEIQRLVNNVAITRPEKTRALLPLNRYEEAAAKALIGELWAKIIARTGYPAPPADGWSKGTAVYYSATA